MNICGIDEVGRGCLAGPVVACAVVLPADYENNEIKDSKKLSAKKRVKLANEIKAVALGVGLGVVCNRLIDKVGIVPATKQAMQIAFADVRVPCSTVVVDAVALNNLPCEHIHPYKAEDSFLCVAAASIVAKVFRDELMDSLHLIYPLYAWDKNKGYGTKAHTDALITHGKTLLHRRSFIKSYV